MPPCCTAENCHEPARANCLCEVHLIEAFGAWLADSHGFDAAVRLIRLQRVGR
jgi:hypothetical protein